MRKITEFKKNDPQKFWGVIIVISIVLVAIIAGIFFPKEEEVQKNEVAAVEVPVDTMLLNQEKGSNYSSSDDYFDVGDVQEQEPVTEPVVEQETKAKSYSQSYSSNQIKPRSPKYNIDDYSYKEQSLKQSAETNNKESGSGEGITSKGRKRTPSDSFTVSGSSRSGNSSSCKVVIDNRQRTVKTGSTVYMHSSNEFTLGGITVPKNTMMQGVAQFSGERLKITVTQIKIMNEYHNVSWKVYDSGIEGVYCPERLTDNIAKDGADEVIDGGNKVEANVPVIGSVKLNLKKKNNESSVILPDGYKLTLHE